MTELSFLTGLLREAKLPKSIRDKILDRLDMMGATEVWIAQSGLPPGLPKGPNSLPIGQVMGAISNQCASTQAIMARNPDLIPAIASQQTAAPRPEEQELIAAQQRRSPTPVTQIAQTPAAMSAMASRQQAISESLAGKIDKQTGRPRKF